MLIIWGLRVIYRTLGRGVFFCRRCGGDREYRHRAGRRFVTVFFIPLIPLPETYRATCDGCGKHHSIRQDEIPEQGVTTATS